MDSLEVGIYNLGNGQGNCILEIIDDFSNKLCKKMSYKIFRIKVVYMEIAYVDLLKAKN